MELTDKALVGWRSKIEQVSSPLVATLRSVPLALWRRSLAALLLIWLAYSLGRLFWLLYPLPGVSAPPAAVPVNLVASGTGGGDVVSVDREALVSLKLFGEGAEAVEPLAEARPGIEDEARDTRLDLVLKGVVGSNDQESARAMISHRNKQKSYAVGDSLPGGAKVTLAKVLVDRVILDNGGRYESLWLYDEENRAQASRRAAPPSKTRATIDRSRKQSRRPPEEQMNLQSLIRSRQVSLHREGGQVVGYRINANAAGLAKRFGLQAGDVVTAVNGQSLVNPGNLASLTRQLSNAKQARVTVRRNGQEVVVNVDIPSRADR